MLIFKVPTRSGRTQGASDAHTGYVFTTSKTEANKVYKENGADPARGDEIEPIKVAFNTADIIDFLNTHCSHPDNG